MRLSSIPIAALAAAAATATLAYAQDAAHWASIASKAEDGIIKLDSGVYAAILRASGAREGL